jgi:hypothetical protein
MELPATRYYIGAAFFLRDGRSIVAPKHAEKAKLRTNGKNYFLAKLMGGEI